MTVAADVAVRNALALYLQTTLGLSADACQPDWYPATMALPRPVAVSIHNAGNVARTQELSAPIILSLTPNVGSDPPTTVALYRLGEYEIPLALDVWCQTQAKRDELIALIEDALNQPVSISGVDIVGAAEGLTLNCTSGDYFSAPAAYDCNEFTALATPEGVAMEEWRATFAITARVDRLVQKTIVSQVTETIQLENSPTVDVSNETPTGTVYTIFTDV